MAPTSKVTQCDRNGFLVRGARQARIFVAIRADEYALLAQSEVPEFRALAARVLAALADDPGREMSIITIEDHHPARGQAKK